MRYLGGRMRSNSFFKVLAISAVIAGNLSGTQRELITKLTVKGCSMRCTIHPEIKDVYLTDNFFIDYEQDINLESMDYAVLTMPIVFNLFSLVWFSGKDFYVDSMDQDVYDSLIRLKIAFHFLYPDALWNGNIIPRKLVSLKNKFASFQENNPRKALLFSGGLDSTSSFFEHKDEDLLLITAWGQFDLPLHDENQWLGRKKNVEEFAQAFGKQVSIFRSNYSEIFNWKVVNNLYKSIGNWRICTIEGMSWAGLTAPILISKKCSALYIAAGANWYYPILDVTCPFIEELTRFAGFHLITDQFSLTRNDKVAYIVDVCKKESLKPPFLKVCYYPNSNCTKCRKCCMTMISLLGLGEDLETYGFSISDEQAVANTLNYMNQKIGHFDAWNFKETLLHLKKFPDKHKKKSALKPFLDYDMSALQVMDRRFSVMGKWKDVKHINPTIIIPTNLSQDILDLQV